MDGIVGYEGRGKGGGLRADEEVVVGGLLVRRSRACMRFLIAGEYVVVCFVH